MLSNYLIVQEWLRYLASQPWAIGLGSIAIFWIAMQLLPNTVAGGTLFERKFAWISSAVASVVVFLVFVIPNITFEFAMAIVIVGVLVGLTLILKKYVH